MHRPIPARAYPLLALAAATFAAAYTWLPR